MIHSYPFRLTVLLATLFLASCHIAKPRTDDPWEGFNRKVFTFNQAVDKVTLRPIAKGYRHITTPGIRQHTHIFFDNITLPVTIANDLLQAKPKRAIQSTGRFLVNMGIGFLGFFDIASDLGIPEDNNNFSITLARWGVPDGPFLMVPLLGPSTARDVWRLPVDAYFFNPLSIYARKHSHPYKQEYYPALIYLITLREQALNVESYLESAYDPYVFLRDAYRQRQLYNIYYGNPPDNMIEQLEGVDENDFDPEQLMQQQEQWEQTQKNHKQDSATGFDNK